jgi:hypothetical protein
MEGDREETVEEDERGWKRMRKYLLLLLSALALFSASAGVRGVNSHYGFEGYDEFYGVGFCGYGYFLSDDTVLTGSITFGKGDLLLGGSWTRWEDETVNSNYLRGLRVFAFKRFPYGEESALYGGIVVGREDSPQSEEWGFTVVSAFKLPLTFDGNLTFGFQYGDYGSFGNFIDGFVNIFYDFGGIYIYGTVKSEDSGYKYDFQVLELGVGRGVDNVNVRVGFVRLKMGGEYSEGVGVSVEVVSESW